MRCGTLAFPFKGIALPDGALTFTVGMPDLGTKKRSAVPAFQFSRKQSAAVMAPSHVLPPLHLQLPPATLGMELFLEYRGQGSFVSSKFVVN